MSLIHESDINAPAWEESPTQQEEAQNREDIMLFKDFLHFCREEILRHLDPEPYKFLLMQLGHAIGLGRVRYDELCREQPTADFRVMGNMLDYAETHGWASVVTVVGLAMVEADQIRTQRNRGY